ncbi:MAG TPA: universal stress protein [Pirellulaceae bacterium]|nr:universal stress protein [Pirellulaceae bacterium]
MMKRILVGLAGTTYTPVAIQRAVALAKAHDAEVTGVTVLDPRRLRCGDQHAPQPEPPGGPIPISPDCIEESIQRLEQSCQEAGVKHRVLRESGDTFTKLIDAARYHDLLVFGLQSVLKHGLPGGDPHGLLIRLVGAGVRPLIAVSEEFRSISRVLIAYNGSMESAKAMKHFVQMRLWPGAELKIMTFHSSHDKAYELMLPAEEYCRAHGFRVCHQSNPGDPKVLLSAAATLWQADMIVMGNSARSVLVRKVLGDTLVETLRDSKIPLFLAQ